MEIVCGRKFNTELGICKQPIHYHTLFKLVINKLLILITIKCCKDTKILIDTEHYSQNIHHEISYSLYHYQSNNTQTFRKALESV